MSYKAVVMTGKDNVATALEEIPALSSVKLKRGEETLTIVVKDKIPFGHKFALMPIAEGQYITKYGQVIGAAICDISEGSHVHAHNVESLRGRGDKK